MGYEVPIDNATPFRVRAIPMDDLAGRDVLLVVAKLSWRLLAAGPKHRALVAALQSPIRVRAQPTFQDLPSSPRCPADLWADKPGTDVLMVGTAIPPRNTTQMDVRLVVGAAGAFRVDKTVRVYGPRVYFNGVTGLTPGPPARLARTPLIYELAYGGVDRSDPAQPVVHPDNPVGVGYCREPSFLEGGVAPAIESAKGAPASKCAGFGPIGASWEPRVSRAGTLDDAWSRERSPLPPADRDARHACAAPDDQWLRTPLQGDEPVTVTGVLDDEQPLAFALPRYAPVFESVICGEVAQLSTHLDTYWIDTDALRVETTFRTKIAIPRREYQLERVRVRGTRSVAELAREKLEEQRAP